MQPWSGSAESSWLDKWVVIIVNLYGFMVNVIQVLFTLYWFILLAAAIITWVPDLADTQTGQILTRLTDPYQRLFRRFIKPVRLGGIMLDVSWIVGAAVFFIAQDAIMRMLFNVLGSMST